MELPVFQLVIDQEVSSELEVNYVSLVENPAIEKNFLAFNNQKVLLDFAVTDQDERIVIGAAMIPDMPIYRRDDQMGEYMVYFDKPTIKTIAEKFYTKGFQNNSNIDHSLKAEGVCFYQSFFKDTAKGMDGLKGDYPEGTWFLGAKINNDEVWQKVKNGDIKGFSVEGIFQYKKSALSKALSIGDKVRVKRGKEHSKEHSGIIMVIVEEKNGAYAVKMPDGMIHKWYTVDELEVAAELSDQEKYEQIKKILETV